MNLASMSSVIVADPQVVETGTAGHLDAALRFLGCREETHMAPLPPADKMVFVGIDSPWLPPITFGVEPYLELCQSLDQALKELETRFPSHRRTGLSLNARNKRLKRRPK